MSVASSPAERRRQAARLQLEETSTIARLLASDDNAPTEPLTTRELERTSSNEDDIDAVILLRVWTLLLLLDKAEDSKIILLEIVKDNRWVARTPLKRLQETPELQMTNEGGNKTNEIDEIDADILPLPIHYVANLGDKGDEDFNTKILEMLCSIDPETATWGNSHLEVPLHLAVKAGHLRAVQTLTYSCPQSCRCTNVHGNIPLHLALKNQYNPKMTSTLLAQYPRSMIVRDCNGDLPIHLSARRGFAAGVRALLAMYSGLVLERSKLDELLPLDLASQSHHDVEVLIQSRDDTRIARGHDRSASSDSVGTGFSSELEKDHDHSVEDEKREVLDWTRIADTSGLLEQLTQLEEIIEMLLMTALYSRAVFTPREETHVDQHHHHHHPQSPLAPETNQRNTFFVPLHGAILGGRLRRSTWHRLWEMYNKRHREDVDRDGRGLLHACADAAGGKVSIGTLASIDNERSEAPPDEEDETVINESIGIHRVNETFSTERSPVFGETSIVGYHDDELCQMIRQIASHQESSSLSARTDSFGLNPLQVAVMNGASSAVIATLVECCGQDMLLEKWV